MSKDDIVIERVTLEPTILKEIRVFCKGSDIAYGYVFGQCDYIGNDPERMTKERANSLIELFNNSFGQEIPLVDEDIDILDYVIHVSSYSMPESIISENEYDEDEDEEYEGDNEDAEIEPNIQISCIVDTYESLQEMPEKGELCRGTPESLLLKVDHPNRPNEKVALRRDAKIFSKSAWDLLTMFHASNNENAQ
jgi:hypothetical protein